MRAKPNRIEAEPDHRETDLYASTATLLGGLPAPLRGPYDVHKALLDGLPGSALNALLGSLSVLPRSGKRLENAMGVSLRTMQRKKGAGAQRLTTEQAGRTWQFAELLTRVTKVLGSQQAAEEWLERPAIGLNRQSPIDLLATPSGTRIVEQYLTRIEHGVYT